jgi:hypothetical protein
MTLKGIRSICGHRLQVLGYGAEIPDENDLVRKSLRSFGRSIGGFKRIKSFDTTANIREYGVTAVAGSIGSGFPEDFIQMSSVARVESDAQIPIDEIDYADRVESTTGTPVAYYLQARRIGFEHIPDAVYTIRQFYKGSGDSVTADEDVVLGELPIMDDDVIWDAISEGYVVEYWTIKRTQAERDKDIESLKWAEQAISTHTSEMNQLRFAARAQLLSIYTANHAQVKLPSGYFNFGDGHGRLVKRDFNWK